MTATATVDATKTQIGCAARPVTALRRYLDHTAPNDPQLLGTARPVSAAWLVGRKAVLPVLARRIALNSHNSVAGDHDLWSPMRNALDLLCRNGTNQLDLSLARPARGSCLWAIEPSQQEPDSVRQVDDCFHFPERRLPS
jgi:hypothetical protein